MNKLSWIAFGFLSIAIGLYPIVYGLVDMSQGFLGGKSDELLNSYIWYWFFYQHIGLGAVSMLTGWTQFSAKIRAKNLGLHRLLGKIYVIAVLLSGSAGLYLSFYATGGIISGFGFLETVQRQFHVIRIIFHQKDCAVAHDAPFASQRVK